MKVMMDYRTILNDIARHIATEPAVGAVADYIPELSKVNGDHFGIYLSCIDGSTFGTGDYTMPFSIQSISKVFLLTLALNAEGPLLWERVGMEPSGTAFNSLVQLEYERGIPRNPFINAGAIVLCDILLSHFEDPLDEFIRFVSSLADGQNIRVNTAVAESEQLTGHRNYALAYFMKSFQNLHHPVEEVLHLYFNICSIEMSCEGLSQSVLYLANDGHLLDGTEISTAYNSKRMNAILQTCGFYDEAGEFSFRVGLPGKSGVGGGIIAVHPHQYSVAVWSPRLNEHGNSHLGMLALEQLTHYTDSSIF